MAEKEGFEPPRRFRPPGFQDQSLQPLGYFSVNTPIKWDMLIITHIILRCQYYFTYFLLKILKKKACKSK